MLDGDGEVQTPPAGRAAKRDEILNTQDYLVTILAGVPKARKIIRKYLTIEDFTGSVYQKVVQLCYDNPEHDPVDAAKLVSRFESAEEQRLAADMMSDEMAMKTEDISKAVEDAVMKMVKRRTENQLAKAKEENNLKEAARIMRESRKETESLRMRLRAEVY